MSSRLPSPSRSTMSGGAYHPVCPLRCCLNVGMATAPWLVAALQVTPVLDASTLEPDCGRLWMLPGSDLSLEQPRVGMSASKIPAHQYSNAAHRPDTSTSLCP